MKKNVKQTHSSDEEEELENQFLIRFPEDAANNVRKWIEAGTIDSKLTIQFYDNMRYGKVRLENEKLYATLYDLPTVLESYKTMDNINLYKTADICQLLNCSRAPLRRSKSKRLGGHCHSLSSTSSSSDESGSSSSTSGTDSTSSTESECGEDAAAAAANLLDSDGNELDDLTKELLQRLRKSKRRAQRKKCAKRNKKLQAKALHKLPIESATETQQGSAAAAAAAAAASKPLMIMWSQKLQHRSQTYDAFELSVPIALRAHFANFVHERQTQMQPPKSTKRKRLDLQPAPEQPTEFEFKVPEIPPKPRKRQRFELAQQISNVQSCCRLIKEKNLAPGETIMQNMQQQQQQQQQQQREQQQQQYEEQQKPSGRPRSASKLQRSIKEKNLPTLAKLLQQQQEQQQQWKQQQQQQQQEQQEQAQPQQWLQITPSSQSMLQIADALMLCTQGKMLPPPPAAAPKAAKRQPSQAACKWTAIDLEQETLSGDDLESKPAAAAAKRQTEAADAGAAASKKPPPPPPTSKKQSRGGGGVAKLEDEPLPEKIDEKFLWPHGITPPFRYVRKRRLSGYIRDKPIDEPDPMTIKGVLHLLRQDIEAIHTEYEIEYE
ncbi:bromodomain-containing protein DDB_G0280777 [Drosophila busckii]|uniref:bromodomain-containing protein DDB_G0280777 n=1 Tax=Drosophila busckii TaxID=30019 RepID=UPI001432A506|nr:bromodomain-containing protein DDB_G0280777 [Drosophila busckii]